MKSSTCGPGLSTMTERITEKQLLPWTNPPFSTVTVMSETGSRGWRLFNTISASKDKGTVNLSLYSTCSNSNSSTLLEGSWRWPPFVPSEHSHPSVGPDSMLSNCESIWHVPLPFADGTVRRIHGWCHLFKAKRYVDSAETKSSWPEPLLVGIQLN